MLRIATWNVNSVRIRLDHIARFSQEYNPDILCLQETKAKDADFPHQSLRNMGYAHILFSGIPSYNGVAILSKTPMTERDAPRLGRDDGRHLSVILDNYALRVDNVYVPAGGDIPDPDLNDKFAYKMDFMAKMTDMLVDDSPELAILLGDINIAPGEFDVFSHKQMLRVVGHSHTEIDAFNHLLNSNNLRNSLRSDIPDPQRIYSWWSYRVRDWQPESRGMLLDHALLTPALQPHQHQAFLAQVTRGWQPKPSDHAPLIVDLNIPKIN